DADPGVQRLARVALDGPGGAQGAVQEVDGHRDDDQGDDGERDRPDPQSARHPAPPFRFARVAPRSRSTARSPSSSFRGPAVGAAAGGWRWEASVSMARSPKRIFAR